MHDISIALVNYHCQEKILRALTSLMADIEGCPYTVHITVADNSAESSGLKQTLAAQFPQVTYLSFKENVGFGKANSDAFRKAPGRYYFALNPDTCFQKDTHTVRSIIEFMDTNRHIGSLGPKLVDRHGHLQYTCYRFDLMSILIKPFQYLDLAFVKNSRFVKQHIDRLLMKDFDHETARPVDWVLGAALVVRQEVADAVGWFDERFFLYFEDCDWCRRVWAAHWPVYYVPDFVIEHDHARASANVKGVLNALIKNKLARIHAVSWFKYLYKWRGQHKSFTDTQE